MNIHPAFIHFPIVLTCFYAALELFPWNAYWPRTWWEPMRRFFLFTAVPFAALTVITGLLAVEEFGETPASEVHEHAALIFLAVLIVTAALDFYRNNKGDSAVLQILQRLLAFIALVMVFVVGALGAYLIHGDIDPFVTFIHGLFF